ncbi:integrase core domain-containing protein [Xanthobacter versatilis]|uniref:integrase core domain-containing protein n=1 Tax=Xanthobacter autotrophicus (strain ATCC BAA-1158 / Py2) TaxID=78245 RepID=UPI00372CF074
MVAQPVHKLASARRPQSFFDSTSCNIALSSNRSEARAGIGTWISYYNGTRPHSALGGRTLEEVHTACDGINMAA